MSNNEITDALSLTAKLMELHDENAFKARAYSNAAFRLSKLRYDFTGKTQQDIEQIDGIGKGISSKIVELVASGSLPDLSTMLAKTPPGIIELLAVKGLGPKKIRQLWKELNIESIGELLYACNENRLVTLKGFGEKTQEAVRQNIEFRLASSNKFHYASIEKPVNALVDAIKKTTGLETVCVGAFARKCEIIEDVSILIGGRTDTDFSENESAVLLPVNYFHCEPAEFYLKKVELTSTPAHLEFIGFGRLPQRSYAGEADIYSELGLQFIPVELREGLGETELASRRRIPELITMEDLKGILHNHSTYSDGVHSVKEMADYCKELGYQYLGICDHSKTAVYANGLPVERVLEQQKEIDLLNAGYDNFRILKGIESDILGDGSLDYPDEVLKTFDFVVASIHSGMKMDEEKATARIIRAVENPYTSILGHPTGRLLLARPGYPIDHRKVIDACAANNVSIELNAHPYRLDIDWRWIPYCIEKGVKVSVNPDAHHKEGFHDMYYGVCAARKGMLSKAHCLNALGLNELLSVFGRKN